MEYEETARLSAFCERNRCSYIITLAQYETLKEAIRRVLQVYEKEIILEATLEVDLGADSIDLAQIFSIIEQETGNRIEPVDLAQLHTVEDALLLVVKNSSEQSAGDAG